MSLKKENKISKEINKIIKENNPKKNNDYDLPFILKKMKEYYEENNFGNKILLERLRELKINNSFMEMFNGGMIGLVLAVLIGNEEFANAVTTLIKDMFSINPFYGIFGIILSLVIIIATAFIIMLLINLLKYLNLKIMISSNLTDYLNEKEIEIINEMLSEPNCRLTEKL